MADYIDMGTDKIIGRLRGAGPTGRSVTTAAQRKATAAAMKKADPSLTDEDVMAAEFRAHVGDNIRQDIRR